MLRQCNARSISFPKLSRVRVTFQYSNPSISVPVSNSTKCPKYMKEEKLNNAVARFSSPTWHCIAKSLKSQNLKEVGQSSQRNHFPRTEYVHTPHRDQGKSADRGFFGGFCPDGCVAAAPGMLRPLEFETGLDVELICSEFTSWRFSNTFEKLDDKLAYNSTTLLMLLLSCRMRVTFRVRPSGILDSWFRLISLMSKQLWSRRNCTCLDTLLNMDDTRLSIFGALSPRSPSIVSNAPSSTLIHQPIHAKTSPRETLSPDWISKSLLVRSKILQRWKLRMPERENRPPKSVRLSATEARKARS